MKHQQRLLIHIHSTKILLRHTLTPLTDTDFLLKLHPRLVEVDMKPLPRHLHQKVAGGVVYMEIMEVYPKLAAQAPKG